MEQVHSGILWNWSIASAHLCTECVFQLDTACSCICSFYELSTCISSLFIYLFPCLYARFFQPSHNSVISNFFLYYSHEISVIGFKKRFLINQSFSWKFYCTYKLPFSPSPLPVNVHATPHGHHALLPIWSIVLGCITHCSVDTNVLRHLQTRPRLGDDTCEHGEYALMKNTMSFWSACQLNLSPEIWQ